MRSGLRLPADHRPAGSVFPRPAPAVHRIPKHPQRIPKAMALPDIPISDAHLHFWTPETHQWLETVKNPGHHFHRFAPLARAYLPEQYAADIGGLNVRETVYVQANMHTMGGFSPVEEVALQQGIAYGNTKGWPNAIIGYAPLHDPDDASRVLEACKRYPNFRGVRFMLDWHPTDASMRQTDRNDYMQDPEFIKGVQLLGKLGLSFDLQVCQAQLFEAAELAKECPDTQFILNHAGFPLRGQFESWLSGMERLAVMPNVACKMGGFGTYDEPSFSRSETERYVHQCLRVFGPSRCMMASNLPVDLVDMQAGERWSDLWQALRTSELSAADCRKVLRENTLHFYRIKPLADSNGPPG